MAVGCGMYKRYQRLQGCGVGRKQHVDAGKRPNHGRGLDLLEADPATGNNRNQGKCLGTKLGALHWVINKSAYMAIGVDIEAIKHILGLWIAKEEGASFGHK